ncbi:MAG TPA: aldehyde dehydrogenase [Solirubrobacteraceae bacterium]|jgi:acyl-CoA reductase-like NAD-dependent aldehyde dehydrogenase|nr:aldehyde dehydrogenase [Solirubrobacteraceae bacterium]
MTELGTGLDRSVRSFDRLFVGGAWHEPSSDEKIENVSPSTEEPLGTVPAAQQPDVDLAVAGAAAAFEDRRWSGLSREARAQALLRVADEIDSRATEMTHAFTAEVGAPLALSAAHHQMAAAMRRAAASQVHQVTTEEHRSWDGQSGTVVREPIGAVAAVIPRNGPVANASLKLASALAAGCPIVLKPAWEGPVSTMMLAEALAAAELPDGVVSLLPGSRTLGEYLVGHPGVSKVSFTGSTAAGKRVMQVASDRLTRVTLELGGKSAGIVTDDASLEEVLPTLIAGSVGNSGQVCSAITRVLISRSRYSDGVEIMAESLARLNVGDPFAAETDLGPLVAERQRQRVEGYIAIGRDEGARIVTGGGRPKDLDKGWYVEPTLFDQVDNSMRIAREEIFGPVIVAIPYSDLDEAICIANDSEYGLSGSVFTSDPELGRALARRMRTGQIFINGAGTCVAQPFGGFRQSGIGREGGLEGLEAFLETKMIVDPAPSVQG